MSQGKMADDRRIKAAVDLISNLPDEILQHIHCFIPIKVAITTSLLSRRWKHVWCEIPSLSLDATILTAASVNKTLSHYTAPKTKSFHLKTYRREYTPHINRWIKFALSHNVENLSLDFWVNSYPYKLPDFFYNSSSFKQLNINELRVLDLRKSLRLRTLQIIRNMSVPGPTQIVAPHIHSLRIVDSMRSCTLVDVASLTEAKLDICYVPTNKPFFEFTKPGFLQLQEIRGVYFPMLKVKSLTLDTVISQYVVPGIQRLLENSPDLEKLTVRGRTSCKAIPVYLPHNLFFYSYYRVQLYSGTVLPDQCWYVQPKHVTAFVELVLEKTEKLDKMVLLLDKRYLKSYIEDLTATLAHNNNVTIGPLPPTSQR
ncbi:hypothetical protein Bca4012_073804 [Brassica carinata]